MLLSLSFPDRQWPSPVYRRVGSRDYRFWACTAFTNVPAYLFAKPPQCGPLTAECFNLHRYLCKSPWQLTNRSDKC